MHGKGIFFFIVWNDIPLGNIIPGVPKKMIHKIKFFFKNAPSPNGIKSYRPNAPLFGELISINLKPHGSL